MHELRGVALLMRDFPPAVIEPIRVHVAARRSLTAIEPTCRAGLSPASVHPLAQRGGSLRGVAIARFEALGYYLALADELRLPLPGLPAH